jgi:hypothetical protein
MLFTMEQINLFAEILSGLYQHILLSDIPNDAPYQSISGSGDNFALDEGGHKGGYSDLLQRTFQLPNIAERWSEEGIIEESRKLLVELASIKVKGESSPNFAAMVASWLQSLCIEFKEHKCYSTITGLSVESPIQIGQVTFIPLDSPLLEFENLIGKSFRENLHPYGSCLSFSKVTAEWRKTGEIHKQYTLQALNILRFLGSLIWYPHDRRERRG